MMSAPVDPRLALESANQSDLVQQKLSIDAMRKRVSGGPSEEKKLREACEGFESIFLQKMWEQMRKNVQKEGYLHSKDEEAYQSMFDVELAKKMASAGGIGLADMLYEQLGQKLHNASKSTGSGSPREPLPIEPARPAKIAAAEAIPAEAPPADLYSDMPAEDALPELSKGKPAKNALELALEELAASRDPALDPANETYPMFDLQTGAPMNPVAVRKKRESEPRREIEPTPLPERVSAPGKTRPSNAIGGVGRSARHSRRVARAAQNVQSLPGNIQAHEVNPQAAQGAARNAQAGQNGQAIQGFQTNQGNQGVQTGQGSRAEQGIQAAPGFIQAAPGAIPASTQEEGAGIGGWPVKGDVVSSYGRQGDTWNTGVSLAAAPLSPVSAPVSGTVAFVGERDGVGHMTLVHDGGLTSHYANVTTALSPGDRVPAGMEFAQISAGNGYSVDGASEFASRMHFEVRRGELAINPEILLG